MHSAFLVRLSKIKQDHALSPGGRGARKLLVTELRGSSETSATGVEWAPPDVGSRCDVQVMKDVEVAVFTESAQQDRHLHRKATEIYEVLEGRMSIEVEGVEHRLDAGDMIVVNPGTTHEVLAGQGRFLCRVVCVHCGGVRDKSVVG